MPSIIGTPGWGRKTQDFGLTDNRDPSVITANMRQKNAQIDRVLDFFTDSVKPAAERYIAGQAQKEAGEVLSNFDGVDLISGATPEASDAFSTLSPSARNLVYESASDAAAYSYQEALTLEAEKYPLLKMDVTNQPAKLEEQAKLWAQARSNAAQQAGVSALPAAQRIRIAEMISRTDSGVSINLGKTRLNNAARAQDGTLVADAENRLEQAHFQDYGSTGKGDGSPESLGLTLTALRAQLEQAVDRKRANKIFATAIGQMVLTQTDPETQSLMLENLANLADSGQPFVYAGTGDLWNEPVGDTGKTLKTYITALRDQQEKLNGDPYVLALTKKALLAESPEEVRQLILNGAQNAVSVEQMNQVLQISSRVTNVLTNPYEQSANATTLILELGEEISAATDDQQRAEIYKRYGAQVVANPTAYPPGFGLQLAKESLGLIENGSTEQSQMFAEMNAARQATIVTTSQKVDQLLIAKGLELTSSERVAQANELTAIAQQDYRRRYNELDEVGKREWQPETEYEKSLESATKALLPTEQVQQNRQPANMFAASANELQQGLIATNGQFIAAAMPNGLIDSMIRTGRIKGPEDFDKLPERERHTYLLNFLAQYRDKDGATLLSGKDPSDRPALTKAYKKLINEQRGRLNQSSRPNDPLRPQQIAQVELPLGDAIAQYQPDGVASMVAREIQFAETDDEAALALQEEYRQDKIRQFKGEDQEAAEKRLRKYLEPALPMIAGAEPGAIENTEDENILLMQRRFANPNTAKVDDLPLPQVPAAAPAAALPLLIGPMHPIFVAIGINEGTRTPNGGYTKNWSGHRDPGDGRSNIGTISYSNGRAGGTSLTPYQADKLYAGRLTKSQAALKPILIKAGLLSGTQGYNRVMFNVLDLQVQAPLAVESFLRKLPQMRTANFSIESIAKARSDSFYNPATGRLEASGFGNNYTRLYRDQKQRAGTYDYKSRRF